MRTGDAYYGATCGRVANRIAGGKFTLEDTERTLAVNNGPNALHGGLAGFDKVHKHCLSTGKHYTYCLDENRACGDVAFVPNAGDEKGGHLLVLTHDVAGDAAFASGETNRGTSSGAESSLKKKKTRDAKRAPTELLILADDRDDRNPDLRLVGKVKIPVRVPFGFHNEFVAEAELPPGAW